MPILEAQHIVKIYPNGVLANDHTSLSVEQGEIHALVGENGAGKSTLMKVFYGLETPTSGQIFVRGESVQIDSPHTAIARGVGMVHQNFMLVNSFTVAQNIVLGQEMTRFAGVHVDRAQATAITKSLAEQYGLHVDPKARVADIPVGMRQRVEILKALYRGAEILILDEPTAVLTPRETDDLFRAVRQLVDNGKTVVFITHKLREVLEISDRVTVMRDAKTIGSVLTKDTNENELAHMMVGREVFLTVDRPPGTPGQIVLDVRDLTYANTAGQKILNHISLKAREGEIVGIAGVEGNGQTELVQVLAGLLNATSGTANVDGENILNKGPRHVREANVAHIPEDRLLNGIAAGASINDNLVIDRYYRLPFTHRGLMHLRRIQENGDALIHKYNIVAPDGDVPVSALSGGNMQKVIIAREFSASPRLLIAAQPTRGVDIGAIEFIHRQLIQKRVDGLAVLLISADLQEVMKLSDRIAVMHEGEIVALLPNSPDLTEDEIGLYMLGTKRQSANEMAALA